MKRALRENALTICFLLLTFATLAGQAIAGLHVERAEVVGHGGREAPGLL